ncbi:hypothetical protein TNCV_1588801 [Trichonephila clavipes]|uniref:Uncharacterized protein n=1 Tax=Trichonephila clavipes TaxID=2585209 RepID=A0A8X6UZK6_TRICX|nr:hypothetical protein TNCV_1588801 [Trichonephila clavipes]
MQEKLVVSNPLGAGKPTPSPFDLSAKECHKRDSAHPTTAPVVQKMSRNSREGIGTVIERFYRLHKGHTAQMTASKARQGRLSSQHMLT